MDGQANGLTGGSAVSPFGGGAPRARLAPELLADLPAQPTELRDTLTALTAAVHAVGRRLGPVAPTWSLVGILTRGRLLAPAPSAYDRAHRQCLLRAHPECPGNNR